MPQRKPSGFERARTVARQSLADLIREEQKRAQLHIRVIRKTEPSASNDRVARVIVERWIKVAQIEGGVTGALGFLGVPLNFVLFAYFQLAAIVSVAEAYGTPLAGTSGEDLILQVFGRAHGLEDVVRASPRVVGALAKALALKHGLGTLGRLMPMVAAPIAAKLNAREMQRVGDEAMRRFGHVVLIPG
ncbi:MAG: EcsC family protein [Deltaproteobacteria bacterium]|nr:EcsC family protein [Deltaproteobacteria bacterium]